MKEEHFFAVGRSAKKSVRAVHRKKRTKNCLSFVLIFV